MEGFISGSTDHEFYPFHARSRSPHAKGVAVVTACCPVRCFRVQQSSSRLIPTDARPKRTLNMVKMVESAEEFKALKMGDKPVRFRTAPGARAASGLRRVSQHVSSDTRVGGFFFSSSATRSRSRAWWGSTCGNARSHDPPRDAGQCTQTRQLKRFRVPTNS
jgi:hypothetical protein